MPTILAVARRRGHHFSKTPSLNIRLTQGLGVEGDGHSGKTVKHVHLRRKYPDAPNLRQVHLIHAGLFDELRGKGFDVKPGDLGENITTDGLNLLALPRGARLHLGAEAIVEITGLRHPCVQMNRFRPGLMAATLDKAADGSPIFKAGVMSVVVASGDIRPGDGIRVVLPEGERTALEPV